MKRDDNKPPSIIGAIAGDIIGSVFEHNNIKTAEFELFADECTFTDDTILTVAVADAIVNKRDFSETIWEYGNLYPNRGYGYYFKQWLTSKERKAYGSFGNGSAMRVSPVGFAFNSLNDVLLIAEKTAIVTHNHPEGIKGAQAVASAVFLARTGNSRNQIRDYIEGLFGYDLSFRLDDIRPVYEYSVTCQGSVPQAIKAFLESSDYENAIRLAVSIGGDSDTIACITGGIASAFYRYIPPDILDFALKRLPDSFIDIICSFENIIPDLNP